MAKQAFFGIHRRSPKLVFFASLLSRSRRREESSSPPALGEMSSRYSVCRHVDPCRLLLQDVDGGQAIVHLLTGEMCMLLAVQARWVLRYDVDGFGYVRAGEKCKWADDLLKLTLCHDGAEDNEGKLYVFRQVEGGVCHYAARRFHINVRPHKEAADVHTPDRPHRSVYQGALVRAERVLRRVGFVAALRRDRADNAWCQSVEVGWSFLEEVASVSRRRRWLEFVSPP